MRYRRGRWPGNNQAWGADVAAAVVVASAEMNRSRGAHSDGAMPKRYARGGIRPSGPRGGGLLRGLVAAGGAGRRPGAGPTGRHRRDGLAVHLLSVGRDHGGQTWRHAGAGLGGRLCRDTPCRTSAPSLRHETQGTMIPRHQDGSAGQRRCAESSRGDGRHRAEPSAEPPTPCEGDHRHHRAVAQNIEQPVATIMVWAPLRLGSCTQRGSGTVTKPPGWPAGRR